MDYTILDQYGVDYEKGIARCLNDAGFYQKMLAMFLDDDSYYRAKAAYERKDHKELFRCVHELKGACGNAAMTELFDAVSELVELLRSGSADEALIAALFHKVELAYTRARTGVELAFKG